MRFCNLHQRFPLLQTSEIFDNISFKQWDNLTTSPLNNTNIALVTGGSRGLGMDLALQLTRYGLKVIIVDIVAPTVKFQDTDTIVFYSCDITDYEEVKYLRRKIIQEHGIVSLLFNNAGVTRIALLKDTLDSEIQRVIDVNYIGAYTMICTFLPDMLQRRQGYIINIASILGEITPARLTSYGASKGGLIALHKSLTQNLSEEANGGKFVKTLLICPGKINTSMFAKVKTPSTFLAPDVESKRLANYIVTAVEYNMTNTIRSPYYANIVPLFKQLSWPYTRIVKKCSGMDKVTAI